MDAKEFFKRVREELSDCEGSDAMNVDMFIDGVEEIIEEWVTRERD